MCWSVDSFVCHQDYRNRLNGWRLSGRTGNGPRMTPLFGWIHFLFLFFSITVQESMDIVVTVMACNLFLQLMLRLK